MKIVFDTNIYLAASKRNSHSFNHIKRSQPDGPYQLYTSPEIIVELRDRLENKFFFDAERSADFIETILFYTKLVQPRRRVENILRDADDHKILECALEAKAEVIITLDKGLLQLKRFEEIVIEHPRMLKFWFPA